MSPFNSIAEVYNSVDTIDGTLDGQLTLKEQTEQGAKIFGELSEIKKILENPCLPEDKRPELEQFFLAKIETIGLTKETFDLAQLALFDIQIQNFLDTFQAGLSNTIDPATVISIDDLYAITPDQKILAGDEVLSLLHVDSWEQFRSYQALTLHNDFKFLSIIDIAVPATQFPDSGFVSTNNEKTTVTKTQPDKTPTIKINIHGQATPVTPFVLEGESDPIFYKTLPNENGKTIKYDPETLQPIRVFEIGGTYVWQLADIAADAENFVAPFPVTNKPTTGYLQIQNGQYLPVIVIYKNKKTLYQAANGLKYKSNGSIHENIFQHIKHRTYAQIGAQANQEGLPLVQPTEIIDDPSVPMASPYQAEIGYENQDTRTKLGINADVKQTELNQVYLQQSVGFNTDRLTPKQIKLFNKLGVSVEKLKKMTLQEVQLTGLAWYQFGSVDEKILANLGLNVSLKDKSIYGLNINASGSLNWHKLKNLQVLPDVVVDNKYFELIASGRYQAGYVKLPIKGSDFTLRLGAGMLHGIAGATVGTEKKSENATLIGGEIGLNVAGLPRFVFHKGSSLYGATTTTFVLDCTSGIHQYQKTIAGTTENMNGEVIAYQHARTRQGIEFLFQHLEKNPETIALISTIAATILALSQQLGQPENDIIPLFFGSNVTRKIQKIKHLQSFSDGLTILTQKIQAAALPIESIRFQNIDQKIGQRKNQFNTHTNELVVYDLKADIQTKTAEKGIGNEYTPINHSLQTALANADVQVFVDEKISREQVTQLENFLSLAVLYPEKFSGINISIDRKGLGEICHWKQNDTHRRSTFRISPKALSNFSFVPAQTDTNIDFSTVNTNTIELESNTSIDITTNKKIKRFNEALFRYPVFTRIKKITYMSAADFDNISATDTSTRSLALKGNTLVVNIDAIKNDVPTKDIAKVLGKKYWKALESINNIVGSDYRIEEMQQVSGQKNSRLLQLQPATIQKNKTDVCARYQLKDYQGTPTNTIEAAGKKYFGYFDLTIDDATHQKTVTLTQINATQIILTLPDDLDTLNLMCPSAALLVQRPELWLSLSQKTT